MKKAPRITESQYRALLDREWRECLLAAQLRPESVPAGWETTAQVADRLGLAEQTAQRMLLAGVRAGRIARNKFRVRLPGGMVRRTTHYRPVSLEVPNATQESSFPRSD